MERVHRPNRLALFAARGLTATLAAGAVGALVVLQLLRDPSAADRWGLALVSALCAAGFVWAARFARRLGRLRIAWDEAGLWRADAAGPGAPGMPALRLGWRDVRELRERPLRGRVEVVGLAGAVTIPLEFVLEDFDALLAAVVERTPQANPARPLPARFDTRASWPHAVLGGATLVLGGGSIALGLVLGETQLALLGAALVGMMGLLATLLHVGVEVDGDELRLRALARTRSFPLAELGPPRLLLRQMGNQKVLDLSVPRRGSRIPLSVRPPGADLFALYRTLARALDRALD